MGTGKPLERSITGVRCQRNNTMDDGNAAKIHVNEYITDQSYPLTKKSMRSSTFRCFSGM